MAAESSHGSAERGHRVTAETAIALDARFGTAAEAGMRRLIFFGDLLRHAQTRPSPVSTGSPARPELPTGKLISFGLGLIYFGLTGKACRSGINGLSAIP